jgi:Ala-tRNA(Pro) deacylase
MTAATSRDLLARLDALGLATETHHHPAVFTVAESAGIKSSLPGAHSKNLFLKDKKGQLFLVVARDSTRIDLKRLHAVIGASGRLSFGSAELLRSVLGVEPGSVTPFAAINDREGRVAIVLDARLMAADLLNFHPLVNTMTTAIGRADLVTFLRATGHEPRIENLPAPPDENCMVDSANPS